MFGCVSVYLCVCLSVCVVLCVCVCVCECVCVCALLGLCIDVGLFYLTSIGLCFFSFDMFITKSKDLFCLLYFLWVIAFLLHHFPLFHFYRSGVPDFQSNA